MKLWIYFVISNLYDLESYAESIYLKYEPLRQSFPRIQGWPQNVTDLILLHIGSNFEDSLKYCFILRFLSYSATSASRPPPCKMGRMLQVMRGSSAAQCTMQWISFTFLGFLQHWAWSVKLGRGEESSLEWILTIHPWFIKIWNVLSSEKIRSGDTMQLASVLFYPALLHILHWRI